MNNLGASLIALVTTLGVLGAGWVAIQILRTGFDYSAARGNPRNRAQAHEALWDIGKGAVLIAGAAVLAAFVFANIHV